MTEPMPSGNETSRNRCTAAVFRGAGQPLELATFDVPRPQAGEALVRIKMCTICGSDLHTIQGKRVEPTPTVLAHEIIGRVMEVGDPAPCDLRGFAIRPGDEVTWSVCVSCHKCDRCLGGMPQKCRHLTKYGHELATGSGALSGGMAEIILLRPGSTIAKLPVGLPDEAACPINCATATIAAGFRLAGDIVDQNVLVIGAGMLGLTASAFAHSGGAKSVTVCEPNASRHQLAERFGGVPAGNMDQLVNSEKRYDVILECSGAPDAVEKATEIAEIGATIVWIGSVMSSRSVRLDPNQVVRRWISIHGVHNYAPKDLSRAIDFVSEHHSIYPFTELVEKTFPLSGVNDAIDYSIRHRPVRVAIRP